MLQGDYISRPLERAGMYQSLLRKRSIAYDIIFGTFHSAIEKQVRITDIMRIEAQVRTEKIEKKIRIKTQTTRVTIIVFLKGLYLYGRNGGESGFPKAAPSFRDKGQPQFVQIFVPSGSMVLQRGQVIILFSSLF